MVKTWEYEYQKELEIGRKCKGKERFNSKKGPIKALSKIWFNMPILNLLLFGNGKTSNSVNFSVFELDIAS